MLYNNGFACQKSKKKRHQRRTGDVYDIGLANQSPEISERWAPDDREGEYASVRSDRSSLRDKGNLTRSIDVGAVHFPKPSARDCTLFSTPPMLGEKT